MTNNDVFRRLRYVYNLNDDKVMATFAAVDFEVTRAQMSDWLKRDDDPDFVEMKSVNLARFLNGIIIKRRGKKGDQIPKPESSLDNNIILRKLKIAHSYKDVDVIAVLESVDFQLSKSELNAFLQNPKHKNYKKCKDQVLRNFIKGLQLKFRPAEK